MNIAILEDLQSDYETLQNVLKDCMQNQNIKYELYWFKTGEAFLADFSPEKYDLLFFDMLLGDGINGMDTARKVRALGCHTPIVFTTSERDYAVEGYEVQAINYLIKPYEPESIRTVLNRVLSAMQTRRYLTVPVNRGTQCICTDELMWAEAKDHYMELHMLSGEMVRTSLRFEELWEMLPSLLQFSSCYRGIVVNFEYVAALQGNDFILSNGQKVPVSRLKRAEMQKALSDYAICKTREEMGL